MLIGISPKQLSMWVAIAAVLAFATGGAAQTTLIPFSDPAGAWKFLDDGSDPGESWTTSEYDDSKWKSGAAPLGYGEGGLRTAVSYGADRNKKPVTTYFRRALSIDAPAKIRQVVLYLRCDDGALVHINGKEALRQNMPAGKVAADTAASTAVSLLDERIYHRFVVPAAALAEGQNVLAVEVHQSDAASSDLYFDLVVKAESVDEPSGPKLAPAAEAVTRRFLAEHYLAAKTTVPDGYADGGRGMQVDTDGNLSSGREVLVVDRTRDAALQAHLQFARSPELLAKPPLQRATELARYVDRDMTSTYGRAAADDATELLAREHGGKAVLLGDVAPLCGSGACRHRSLLFKILADEAGLDVALVRGNVRGALFSGGHAWNELRLPDGKTVLVDTMNPLPDYYFPDLADPSLEPYRTVDNKPLYPPAK